MKKSKYVYGLLFMGFLLAFIAGAFNESQVKANVKKEISMDGTHHLYVMTEKVSDRIKQFASEKENAVINSLPDVVSDWSKYSTSNKFYYGSPFVLGEVSYFPVLSNDRIIATLGILNDNSMAWSVSQELVAELNEFSLITTPERPVEYSIHGGDVYATFCGITKRLSYNFELTKDQLIEKKGISSKGVEDIYDVQSIINANSINPNSTIKGKTVIKNLALDRKETQNDQSWCSAFAGAQIMRFKGKDKYAYDIMRWKYPYDTMAELKKESINTTELMQYGRKIGFKSTVYSDSTLSFNEVKSQIDSERPIYMGCHGGGDYSKARHALVLRGYNSNDKTYSVWNPWNKEYKTVSSSDKKLVVRGGYFVWDATISNWSF